MPMQWVALVIVTFGVFTAGCGLTGQSARSPGRMATCSSDQSVHSGADANDPGVIYRDLTVASHREASLSEPDPDETPRQDD